MSESSLGWVLRYFNLLTGQGMVWRKAPPYPPPLDSYKTPRPTLSVHLKQRWPPITVNTVSLWSLPCMAGIEREGERGKGEMRLGTEGKPTAPFPLSHFSSRLPFWKPATWARWCFEKIGVYGQSNIPLINSYDRYLSQERCLLRQTRDLQRQQFFQSVPFTPLRFTYKDKDLFNCSLRELNWICFLSSHIWVQIWHLHWVILTQI